MYVPPPEAPGRTSPAPLHRVGVVIIGRNEGERLARCFDSVPRGVGLLIYVDSGSADGSVEEAHRRGIDVVELDLSIPFTAARARGAGFERLLELESGLEFVQFVDGDCELQPGWMDAAFEAMSGDASIAVVSGRLRERFREATVYNRLCDLEWDVPAGEAAACGGNAMMRASAFRDAGGYDGRVIAGEEPELCLRIRGRGHRILAIAAEMALHDAAMTRFGQWWRRAVRTGFGCAELGALHPGMLLRERRSSLFWGLLLPAAAVASVPFAGGLGLGLLMGYPVLWLRIAIRRRRRGDTAGDSALYATFCVLGKAPELIGQAKYLWSRRLHRSTTPLGRR